MITTSTNVLITSTPKPPPDGAWDMITIHTNSGMRNPTGRPRRTGGMVSLGECTGSWPGLPAPTA